MPVKELMRNLPLAIAFEQREHVGSSRLSSSQFARPALDFEMNDCDALDDFDTGETRTDLSCWTVLIDPIEDVFDGTAVFDTLTIAGDGC